MYATSVLPSHVQFLIDPGYNGICYTHCSLKAKNEITQVNHLLWNVACSVFVVFPGCGGLMNAEEDGEISSPGWPGNYGLLQNCTWVIQAQHPGNTASFSV